MIGKGCFHSSKLIHLFSSHVNRGSNWRHQQGRHEQEDTDNFSTSWTWTRNLWFLHISARKLSYQIWFWKKIHFNQLFMALLRWLINIWLWNKDDKHKVKRKGVNNNLLFTWSEAFVESTLNILITQHWERNKLIKQFYCFNSVVKINFVTWTQLIMVKDSSHKILNNIIILHHHVHIVVDLPQLHNQLFKLDSVCSCTSLVHHWWCTFLRINPSNVSI